MTESLSVSPLTYKQYSLESLAVLDTIMYSPFLPCLLYISLPYSRLLLPPPCHLQHANKVSSFSLLRKRMEGCCC